MALKNYFFSLVFLVLSSGFLRFSKDFCKGGFSKILSKTGFDELYPDFEVLPGVGPYTNNAILSFAYHKKVITRDINVDRVISRYFGLDNVEAFVNNNKKILLNRVSSRDLNQAIMDFGSMVCKSKNPLCSSCDLEENCNKNIVKVTKSRETFSGSNRELRGALLKLLLNENIASLEMIQEHLTADKVKLLKAINTLEKDGLITIKKNNLVEIPFLTPNSRIFEFLKF
mgnify:CR=1 FL=1